MLGSQPGILSAGVKKPAIPKKKKAPASQIDYYALTSRIKRRENNDLLKEIQDELNVIDDEVKVDNSLTNQIAKFNQEFELLQYNP